MDYVNVKVKVHKEVIDAHRLGNFLANLARPRMSDNERLALVAMFIPCHLYTAQQAGEVLAQFGFGEEKVQAALLVTFRCGMQAGNEGVAVQRLHCQQMAQSWQALAPLGRAEESSRSGLLYRGAAAAALKRATCL